MARSDVGDCGSLVPSGLLVAIGRAGRTSASRQPRGRPLPKAFGLAGGGASKCGAPGRIVLEGRPFGELRLERATANCFKGTERQCGSTRDGGGKLMRKCALAFLLSTSKEDSVVRNCVASTSNDDPVNLTGSDSNTEPEN